LSALGKVVPTHLLDRDLLAALGEARGKDPWLDQDDDDEGACLEAPLTPLRRMGGGVGSKP